MPNPNKETQSQPEPELQTQHEQNNQHEQQNQPEPQTQPKQQAQPEHQTEPKQQAQPEHQTDLEQHTQHEREPQNQPQLHSQLPEAVCIDLNQVVDLYTLERKSSVFCKICHSGGSSERLIQPCFCKGTVGKVHLSCLERWLNECSVDKCELCHFQFTADHTRRYTAWRSLAIWFQNPTYRSMLYSDLAVITIMTVVVGFLITCLVLGLISFRDSNPDSNMDVWGHSLFAVFITSAVIGYVLTLYTMINDHVRPWLRWWRSCHIIRLNRELLSGPSS